MTGWKILVGSVIDSNVKKRSLNDLNNANKIFEKVMILTKDIENLPRNTQNNIDFIEYKLKDYF